MAILNGDIKLVASKVMLDTPEGGGGPTSNVIEDGQTNSVFTDISELDRTNGRVNLRQLHVLVDVAGSVDIYLGANVIVGKPPEDPNVSITIFPAANSFETRAQAVSRMEAYLSIGPNYSGYLFSNHIQGQATISIFQKNAVVPAIGDTLVLTKREGFSDQFQQYVRVTSVAAVLTDFEDTAGIFQRWVITLGLSDSLRADFPGHDITRYDITSTVLAQKTKISSTIVADAARYYGVVALEVAAELGDFSAKAASMFTQLVPSAQVETPISDVRANQSSVAVVPGGAAVTYTVNALFTTTQSLFIGGAIAPQSLSIVRSTVTMTDEGGRLYVAGSQVGTIDYENGILQLSSNAFGTSPGDHAVTYVPAAVPTTVNQVQGFEVTSANRSLSYVRTIIPVPVKGTLFVDFRSNGRWYRLRDDGSGALRGSDSSFGAGNILATGTITLTLGALPDVGSSVLFGWVEPEMTLPANDIALDNGGKFYFPMNTDGEVTLDAGSKAIQPGALTVTWTYSGTKTVTDDGEGNLTGDGTGTVDYADGVIKLSPTVLPPHGTQINISLAAAKAKTTASSALSSAGPVKTFTFGVTNIKPGTVWITLPGQLKFNYAAQETKNWGDARSLVLADLNGDGNLFLLDRTGSLLAGEIDYASGTGTINQAVAVPDANAREMTHFDNIYMPWTVPVLGMRAA